MKRNAMGVTKIDTLISVQGAYPIRITDAGVLTCDYVIKVPLGYKSIDYEDFDDILGDELTVLIGGRSVE